MALTSSIDNPNIPPHLRGGQLAGSSAAPVPQSIMHGINFGTIPSIGGPAPTDADSVIRNSLPAAQDILRKGTGSASQFSRKALQGVEDRLRPFLHPEALHEQSALLGAQGASAQGQAIANIPVSAAQAEAERRESVGLRRRASARGELGSGASLLASGQLAGQQQTNRVANRVEQLEQLAGIDRQILSDISRQRESELSRQSALRQGLGVQISNVGLGLSAPVVESIQTQAELSGLRGISQANASAQRSGQMANLAGQLFTPQNIQAVGGMFNSTPTTPATTTTQNLNFNQALA